MFKQEVVDCAPDYIPETVTTDGWEATRSAWEALFPGIVWILCFLHEVIKIRDWCRSKLELRHTLIDKLWHIYHATSKRHFAQRLRRFLEWAKTASLSNAVDERVRRLRDKSPFFQRAFDFPDAYRTSNQADRPMNYFDRTLYAMQDFHGSWEASSALLLCLAAEGMEVPQYSHGSSRLNSSVPGTMKVLHRKEGTVKIIHWTVHLIASAWRSLKVIGSLKEGRFGLQALQSGLNRRSEVLVGSPFKKPSESLGKYPFAVALVDMPKLLPQNRPLFRG